MVLVRLFVIFFGWFVVCCSSSYSMEDLPETIKKIKPSIVGVGSYDPLAAPRMVIQGTGFAVKSGHHIVTNTHVIAPIQKTDNLKLVVFVGIGKNAKIYAANPVLQNDTYDLAILKVEGVQLSPMTISAVEAFEGEQVAFTGFPIGAVLGLFPVTHRGIISSVTPIAIPASTSKRLTADLVKRLRKPYFVYQLDATAYPGNSGSPLYNQNSGEVVGIINKVFVKKTKEAVISDPSGITYAIPATFLKQMLKEIP